MDLVEQNQTSLSETPILDERTKNILIKKVKKKGFSIFDIPEECHHIPEISEAERQTGFRRVKKCGYDFIQNQFFVEEKIRGWSDDILFFPTFDEFFVYLNGQIYRHASYYQYVFSSEDIAKYSINLSHISRKPFIHDNIDDYTENPTPKETKDLADLEQQKQLRLERWKFIETSPTIANLKKDVRDDFHFFFFDYVKEKGKDKLSDILADLDSRNFSPYHELKALCYFFDPAELLQSKSFSPSVPHSSHYKNDFLCFAARLKSGDALWRHQRYYDGRTRFYTDWIIADSPGDNLVTIPLHFATLKEFAKYLHGDLSGCDLSGAPISLQEVVSYKIDGETKLPPQCYSALHRRVSSSFNRFTKKSFEVTLEWTNETGLVIKERRFDFPYFVDYAAFLKGNFAGANLLFCDRLADLHDLSGLDFTHALLPSSVLDKIGIPYKPISLPAISQENTMTLTNEEKTVQEFVANRIGGDIDELPIFYISDIHLTHRIAQAKARTNSDILRVFQSLIDQLLQDITSEVYERGKETGKNFWPACYLLIGGDTTSYLNLFDEFIAMLSDSVSKKINTIKIIFVLGNHETWPFSSGTLDAIYDHYRQALANNGFILLQNELLCFDDLGHASKISADDLQNQSKEEIRERTKQSRILIFGGTGFSGYDATYPVAYGTCITPTIEKEETHKFESLYHQVEEKLGDRRLIILTHMPMKDWASKELFHPNFIYVSGHTHWNAFFDDGITRIYSDNQIGYHGKNVHAKYFSYDNRYDIFSDYTDGVYPISKEDYLSFQTGKNFHVDYNRDSGCILMLKKQGFYCFITQGDKGELCILNGGAKKRLPQKEVTYFYDQMDQVINTIKTPLDDLNNVLKQISDNIRRIGGTGRIHGTIIDIDFFNHLYFNCTDGKVTAYFATSIIDKTVYPNLLDLLKERCPAMYKNYQDKGQADASLNALIQVSSNNSPTQLYLDTNIYENSRKIKKMQKLSSNILCIWPDRLNPLPSLNAKKMIAKKD